MKEKGTRTRRGRIILVLLLFLLIAALVIIFINRNNIKALYKGLTTNAETIGVMLEQNNNATKDALSQSGMEMTDEDFAKINSGELTEEEIADLLYNRLNGENASIPENAPSSEDNSTQDVSNSSEANSTPAEDDTTQTSPDEKEDVSTPSNGKNDSQSGASSKTDVSKTETTDKKPATDKTTQNESVTKDNKNTDRTDSSKPKADAKDSKTDASSTSRPSGAGPANKTNGSASAATDSNSSSTNAEKTQPSGITSTTKPGSSTQKVSDEEYNRKVAELIAQVYVIKANFTSQLSAFESSIINSYKALPAEQRTAATKARIVSENMGYIAGLEAQCDAQINAVTTELKAFLASCGRDTSLVDSINTAYANEKELKKAYYISLYK